MGIYKLPKDQWTKDGRKYKYYWNEKDKSGKWKKKFSQAYKTKLDAMNAEREFLNNKIEFGGDMDMTFGMMHRINKRIAENADIRRIPLHSFRHSCASLLINTGQPPTTVYKYLGHASTKETLDTYAHMFPNNLGDVKNTIDNLNLGI